MAVTEEARHDLHTYFRETMGHERAATMMELLPPLGWGDLATKQDIHHLREWAAIRFDTMATKADVESVRSTLYRVLFTQTLVVVAAMVGLLQFAG